MLAETNKWQTLADANMFARVPYLLLLGVLIWVGVYPRALVETIKPATAQIITAVEKDKKAMGYGGIAYAKGIKARKALIVQHVMNSRKIDTAAYTEPEINATWKVLVGNAAKKPEAKAARLPMPAPIHVNNAAQADSQGRKHPIFR